MTYCRAVCVLIVLTLAASSASAALAVTDPAFAISSVIPGWLSAPIAFTSDGTLWSINQADGCLYKFVSVSGNPSPPTTAVKTSNYCLNGSIWDWGLVATASDRLFTATGLEVTALKTGGAPVAYVSSAWLDGKVRGITAHPTTGDLYIAGFITGYVYQILNPDTNTGPFGVTKLRNSFGTNGALDGIAVGPDGRIYAAATTQARLVVMGQLGSVIANPQVLDNPVAGYGPDGVAVVANNTFVVTSRSSAQALTKWTIPSYTQSKIADTNGYNDYMTVGPDKCIYVTSLLGPDGIIRLSNHDGSCFV